MPVADRDHCHQMLARFAWPTQAFKMLEEMGEMLAAIGRLEYALSMGMDEDTIEHQILKEQVAEEIADYLETIDQYVIKYRIEPEVEMSREIKRGRTAERYLFGGKDGKESRS